MIALSARRWETSASGHRSKEEVRARVRLRARGARGPGGCDRREMAFHCTTLH